MLSRVTAKNVGDVFFETQCNILTPEKFILKLCTPDYFSMQILVSIGTVVASLQIDDRLPLYNFFDCPYFFLGHAPRSKRWTDFHAFWLERRVSAHGGVSFTD